MVSPSDDDGALVELGARHPERQEQDDVLLAERRIARQVELEVVGVALGVQLDAPDARWRSRCAPRRGRGAAASAPAAGSAAAAARGRVAAVLALGAHVDLGGDAERIVEADVALPDR